jgi:hypothetical protein
LLDVASCAWVFCLLEVALFFVGRARRLGLFSRELHLVTLSAAFVHMALQPLPAALLVKLPASVLRNHNTTLPPKTSSSHAHATGSSSSSSSSHSSGNGGHKRCGKCICHVLSFCPCCLLFAHTKKRRQETV